MAHATQQTKNNNAMNNNNINNKGVNGDGGYLVVGSIQ